MDDSTAVALDSIIEIPVTDASLFLLNKRNHAFLNGTSARAFVVETYRTPGLFVVLGIAALTFLVWFFVQLSTGDGVPFAVTGQGAFWVGVFLVLVLLAVFFDYRGQIGRRKQPVEAPERETPVFPPLAVRSIGVVVGGEVVEAQKVVYPGRDPTTGSLKIRYRFTTPNGSIVDARAEGSPENATDDVAPVAGTPVRVWYIDAEKYYLL